jgi:hypothetical protein
MSIMNNNNKLNMSLANNNNMGSSIKKSLNPNITLNLGNLNKNLKQSSTG